MKNYILIIALLLVGCAREKPEPADSVPQTTNFDFNASVYSSSHYTDTREQRVQEQADAIIRAMTNADVIAAWKPKPEPSYAPPQIYTMPPFNWSTNGWMKGGTNFYLQNMGSHEERL